MSKDDIQKLEGAGFINQSYADKNTQTIVISFRKGDILLCYYKKDSEWDIIYQNGKSVACKTVDDILAKLNIATDDRAVVVEKVDLNSIVDYHDIHWLRKAYPEVYKVDIDNVISGGHAKNVGAAENYFMSNKITYYEHDGNLYSKFSGGLVVWNAYVKGWTSV